ncbi:Serpentine Receptor, class H [Caenorhabditis elegans]|uniref:Serpentine Receptor, class H n=1 Tax=Caenorhabditis elegans TaxID=6239 RepID=P91980_CAEEL|nr:Serpentine Receptor, class H [Caenorhabditis elegans]CAB02854.1 Serpentine Receptor, class H [Caenorhabditis elegans]|eukprot:NP_506301.1 Serpentine Receptor, class H [Caenorhabditis elegans]
MDCSLISTAEYLDVLHFLFIVSFPIYTVAIIALFRTKSTYFETYKHFLVWHTASNLISEIYNAWFLAPKVHLPYPLIRFTAIMTQLGFSGLFQFYTINALIHQTGYSIIEMYMFRFKASTYNFQSTCFYVYLQINLYIYRITLVLFFVVNITTYNISLGQQIISKQNLLIQHPEAPWLVNCDSVVVAAPFTDPISMFNVVVWIVIIFVASTSTFSTTIYLQKHLSKSEHHSPAVLRMHRMLLITLFVQTAIHAVMLGIPNSMFIYAVFFEARHEFLAKIAFCCLTYHGLASTIAMMTLTKPIKITILQMLRCHALKNSVSTVQYSSQNT